MVLSIRDRNYERLYLGGELPYRGFATSEVTSSCAFQTKATNLSKSQGLVLTPGGVKAL